MLPVSVIRFSLTQIISQCICQLILTLYKSVCYVTAFTVIKINVTAVTVIKIKEEIQILLTVISMEQLNSNTSLSGSQPPSLFQLLTHSVWKDTKLSLMLYLHGERAFWNWLTQNNSWYSQNLMTRSNKSIRISYRYMNSLLKIVRIITTPKS